MRIKKLVLTAFRRLLGAIKKDKWFWTELKPYFLLLFLSGLQIMDGDQGGHSSEPSRSFFSCP